MDIDDGQLIELVRQFHIIYDSSHKDYCNNDQKSNAWKTIEEVLDKPAADCEARWATPTNYIRKGVEKSKNYSIWVGGNKPWKWLDEMGFLSAHVKRRKNTGNLSKLVVEECPNTDESSGNRWDTMQTLLEDRGETPPVDINEELETSTHNERVYVDSPSAEASSSTSSTSSCTGTPKKIGRKKAQQDDLVTTISSLWGLLVTVLRERSENTVELADTMFGKMVGYELASIKNENAKYHAKQTILRALHEAKAVDN